MPEEHHAAGQARAMEFRVARALRDVLEPYHAVVILAPRAQQAFHDLGLTDPWSGYFAGRAAPLGAVPPSVVDAVFYHFNPAMIERNTASLWAAAAPEKVLSARLVGVDAALREILGEEALGSEEIMEASTLAVEAARACTAPGRPLGAANAALPVPAEPHLALWQAATTLREFRGDGHNAALLQAGLDGVEALVTITAAGGEVRKSIQRRREWTDADWAAAERRLAERGLLAPDGTLTAEGRAVRDSVEDLTDRLALPPWQKLGTVKALRLYDLARPIANRIIEALRLAMPPLPESAQV
ncbi:SCO6745 family protein [Streptomyces sp. 7N604]|uniref:SCO6745 family protein n=1 Tax=Streptomyces sp. 7N604 TaxID=3457415 RepID=UPI003FD6B26D